MADPMTPSPSVACRNCRRPLQWVRHVGWLHGELPQYAHEPLTCDKAQPVCVWGVCSHSGCDPSCTCRCHITLVPRPTQEDNRG